MIDYLELRAPLNTSLGAVWAGTNLKPVKRLSSGNYSLMQDLTPDIPVKVYWDNRFGHGPKLQFVGVGALDAEAILTTVRNVFDTEPLDLDLVRVDFAVDVEIPLQWFAENLTVARKRRKEGWGCGTPLSRWEGNTLYFGKVPSVFRIYDKKAELQRQHVEISNDVLTRVEHQAHGKTLTRMGLYTLGDLLQLDPELDPFKSVRLPDQVTLTAPINRPSLKTQLASIGLLRELETMSLAQLEVRYKNMGYPNAADTLDKLLPFTRTEVVQVPNLSALFSASAARQLYGNVEDLFSPPDHSTSTPLLTGGVNTRIREKCSLSAGFSYPLPWLCRARSTVPDRALCASSGLS